MSKVLVTMTTCRAFEIPGKWEHDPDGYADSLIEDFEDCPESFAAPLGRYDYHYSAEVDG